MQKKIFAFFLGVLYIIFLTEAFRSPVDSLFVYLLFGFILLALTVLFFNYYFYRSEIKLPAGLIYLFLPIFWIIGSSSVLFIWPPNYWRYFLIYFFALFLIAVQGDLAPRKITSVFENIFFVSAIGIFMGIWEINYVFTPGWWIIMLMMFVAGWLLFSYSFFLHAVTGREKVLYPLIFAFLFSQLAWAQLFLPFHFLAMAAITASVFYSFWILAKLYFLNILNRQKITFHIAFSLFVIVLTLLGVSWLPTA